MSTKKKDNKTTGFPIYWASGSVLLLLLSFILLASFQMSSLKNLGKYTATLAIVSLVAFFAYSFFKILFSGDKSFTKNLVIIYITTCLISIFAGIADTFFNNTYGWYAFFIGLAGLILFWIGVLFYFIFKK